MKIFLNENFSIASVTDDVGESIVRGSETFDKLYVYIPTAIVDSYTSVAPLYSVKRADGRELGRYATLTNSDASQSGYYGYYGSFNSRDIAVAGALQVTITLKLTNATGTQYKSVAVVTTTVTEGVAVADDVFVVGNGGVYTSLKASLDALTESFGSKADRNNANQTIVAGIVQASSITKGGVSVATTEDVASAVGTETTNRQNADTTLQNNIDAEATARANADALKVNISDVVNNLTDTSTNKPLSAYQGKILKDLITSIQTLLASDDTTLDEIQEIVDYIKANRSLIESITAGQVSVSDIIDNLTSAVSNKPLSANQGYILKGLVDALTSAVTTNTTKLEGIAANATKVEGSQTNGNIKINNVETNVYTLPNATANILGGVKIGNYINVDENGVISISLASATNDGLLTQAQYSKLQEIINYSLSITVGNETTTYTTIPTIIDAVYGYLAALQQEVASLEGSDTTFSQRIVAIENDLSSLQSAWTTFMAGTDADNITDTLLSVQQNVASLQTNVSGLLSDVSNLKAQMEDTRITESGTAYRATIPSAAKEYGTLKKLGGYSKFPTPFHVINQTYAFESAGTEYYYTLDTPLAAGTYYIIASYINEEALTNLFFTQFFDSSNNDVTTSGGYTTIHNFGVMTEYSKIVVLVVISGTATKIRFTYGGYGVTVKDIQLFTESEFYEGVRSAAITSIITTDGTNTSTYTIPEEITSITGYGQSNPDDPTEYNYIDFERQKFVMRGYISAPTRVYAEWNSSPREIDISSFLKTSQIQLYSGGTITFGSQYDLEAPYEYEYTSSLTSLLMMNYENDKKQQENINLHTSDFDRIGLFKSGVTYHEGDIIFYYYGTRGIYKALTTVTASSGAGPYDHPEIYENLGDTISTNTTNIASMLWTSGKSYSATQVAFYNGYLYVCTTAHTSSSSILPTNTSYWQPMFVE